MPCDSIQLNTLEIPNMNGALLRKALEKMGATGIVITANGARAFVKGEEIRIAGGRMVVRAGAEHLADQVKQQYSKQALFLTAQRNGWKLKQTGPLVYQVVK